MISSRPTPDAHLATDHEPISRKVAQNLATFIAVAQPALLFGAAGLALWTERAWDRRRAPLAAEAARVLAACQTTAYTHDALVDASRGVYDLDCSAFVGLLLERVAPAALERVPRAAGATYPRAFEFYEFLTTGAPGWGLVPKLADVARGDVICWRLPLSPSGDTGHIMVVSRAPVFDAARQLWRVGVYDSSSVPHFDDSRGEGATYHGGVGAGSLRFRADVAGRPAQFQFGPDDALHAHPIVVARLHSSSPGYR
jgi:hypothetical protein